MSNVVFTEDFETLNDAPVHDNGKCGTTTDPGNGWETADENPHIEYQEEGLFRDFQAPSGSVWVELDAHYNNPGSTEISKEFTSEAGHLYRVSFALGVRPGTSVDQNKIGFTATSAAGETLYSQIYSADDGVSTEGLPAGWQWMVATFTATDSRTKISFADAGVVNDTYGSLLDNVAVVDMTPVVSVVTTDGEATEHDPEGDPGIFEITRTGDFNEALTVYFSTPNMAPLPATDEWDENTKLAVWDADGVEDAAPEGDDDMKLHAAVGDFSFYLGSEISESNRLVAVDDYFAVTFAAGESSKEIYVRGIDDTNRFIEEDYETVALTIENPDYVPGSVTHYDVGYRVGNVGLYNKEATINLTYINGKRNDEVGKYDKNSISNADGRIFIDTDEDWNGDSETSNLNAKDKQSVVIGAEVTLPPNVENVTDVEYMVLWELYDPDDPGKHIDADEDGGDNTGKAHEGSTSWFGAFAAGEPINLSSYATENRTAGTSGGIKNNGKFVAGSAALTKIGDNGKTSVRFYFGDDGGDNYQVRAVVVAVDKDPETGQLTETASVGDQKESKAADTSGVMTAWRKRWVVVDAMAKSHQANDDERVQVIVLGEEGPNTVSEGSDRLVTDTNGVKYIVPLDAGSLETTLTTEEGTKDRYGTAIFAGPNKKIDTEKVPFLEPFDDADNDTGDAFDQVGDGEEPTMILPGRDGILDSAGLLNFYPGENIGTLQTILHTAYANADANLNTYIDIFAKNGKLNCEYRAELKDGVPSELGTTEPNEIAEYLLKETSYPNSPFPENTYHLIGVAFAEYPTILGRPLGFARGPHAIIPLNTIFSECSNARELLKTVVVHELAHTLLSSTEKDPNGNIRADFDLDHNKETNEDIIVNCAIQTGSSNEATTFCPEHTKELRDAITRSYVLANEDYTDTIDAEMHSL